MENYDRQIGSFLQVQVQIKLPPPKRVTQRVLSTQQTQISRSATEASGKSPIDPKSRRLKRSFRNFFLIGTYKSIKHYLQTEIPNP